MFLIRKARNGKQTIKFRLGLVGRLGQRLLSLFVFFVYALATFRTVLFVYRQMSFLTCYCEFFFFWDHNGRNAKTTRSGRHKKTSGEWRYQTLGEIFLIRADEFCWRLLAHRQAQKSLLHCDPNCFLMSNNFLDNSFKFSHEKGSSVRVRPKNNSHMLWQPFPPRDSFNIQSSSQNYLNSNYSGAEHSQSPIKVKRLKNGRSCTVKFQLDGHAWNYCRE